MQKNITWLYEQGATKKRIGLYWVRWLCWAASLAIVPSVPALALVESVVCASVADSSDEQDNSNDFVATQILTNDVNLSPTNQCTTNPKMSPAPTPTATSPIIISLNSNGHDSYNGPDLTLSFHADTISDTSFGTLLLDGNVYSLAEVLDTDFNAVFKYTVNGTALQFTVEADNSVDTLKGFTVTTQNRIHSPNLSNLKGSQGDESGLLFDKTQGNVTLSFDITDPDGGTYTYSWANSNNALLLASGGTLSSSTDAAPVLDLSTLTAGRYFIEVQVTDSTASSKPASKIGIMLGVSDITLSTTADTDDDGKTDSSEGLGDDDGDGIANYLDAFDTKANVIQTSSGALAKVASGLRMMPGSATDGSSLTISLGDLASKGDNGDPTTNSALPGVALQAIFDYQIEGLEVPSDPDAAGNSVVVVLPLSSAMTADTVFNKYDAVNGWKAYIEDANNQIQWAAFENGVEGNCPDTDSSDYSSDLSEKVGKTCLKVTLQDGGLNDADGVVDGRIVDPLGVGDASSSGGGGNLGWFSLLLLFGVGLARRLMFIGKKR